MDSRVARIVLPDGRRALAQARAVVDGLEVDTRRMRANLDMTNGLAVVSGP